MPRSPELRNRNSTDARRCRSVRKQLYAAAALFALTHLKFAWAAPRYASASSYSTSGVLAPVGEDISLNTPRLAPPQECACLTKLLTLT